MSDRVALGWGPHPSEAEARAFAQVCFLRVLEAHCPAVLEALTQSDVSSWAHAHGVRAPWLLAAAEATKAAWHAGFPPGAWYPLGFGESVPTPLEFDATREHVEAFVARARASVRSAPLRDARVFLWLAHHRFGQRSYAAIAAADRVERGAVRMAVRRLEAWLELP